MAFLRFHRNVLPLKTIGLSVLAGSILFLWGCAHWTIPGTIKKEQLSRERIDSLVSRFALHSERDTLKTMAHISIDHPTGKYVRKVALLARRPASLRIDAIPLFGPSDFFMSVSAGQIRVLLPGNGTYYVSPATKENLARFFHIPMPVDHTVSILMGIPPLAAAGDFVVKGFHEGRRDRLDLLSGGTTVQSLWFDEHDDIAEIALFGTEGSRLYTVSFDDYITFGGGTHPGRLKITIEDASGRIFVSVRYIDPEIVRDGDLSPFDLPIPAGIEPRFLK